MSKEEYGKTIKIFLPNGNTDNVKIASIANSTVQATLIPRNILDSINDYEEISSQGIYFLLDNDNNVYVGEAENVRDRIIQHNKSKDWWVKVITINVISINSPLTKADIKFLELLTYNKIEEAGRYKLDQTIPAKATVSRDRKADLMHIYEDIKMLVSVLSYPLFNPQRQTADDTVDEEEKLVFYMNRNNISASGEYTSEGFLLYAGSQLKDISTKSFIEGNSGGVLLKEIEELHNDITKVEKHDGYYKTTEDILFSTPSRAAEFVIYNRANGWTEFKTKDKKTLKEIYRIQK